LYISLLSTTFVDANKAASLYSRTSILHIPNEVVWPLYLEEMRHFQCADIRDKLYGILSLVGWGTCERPEPDYSKDGFEVSVMILELYMEDGLLVPVSGTYLEWARQLHEVFEVSPDIESMQAALELRCSLSLLPKFITESRDKIFVDGATNLLTRKRLASNRPGRFEIM
jgi:hypothetical protein